MRWFKNWFSKENQAVVKPLPKLPPKDPNDWKLTENSRPWVVQQYWCYTCKTNRSNEEFMSDICNNCGRYKTIGYYGCSVRQIWNGEKWVRQFNERGNGSWVENN